MSNTNTNEASKPVTLTAPAEVTFSVSAQTTALMRCKSALDAVYGDIFNNLLTSETEVHPYISLSDVPEDEAPEVTGARVCEELDELEAAILDNLRNAMAAMPRYILYSVRKGLLFYNSL